MLVRNMNTFHLKSMIPTRYRILEGLSTSMLPGYLLGGGPPFSLLAFSYFVHWLASFNYHMHPVVTNFWLDIHFIDLVAMERLYHLYGNIWVYPIFLFLVLSKINEANMYVMFFKVALVCSLVVCTHSFSWQYTASWWIAALLFLIGDQFLSQSRFGWAVLFHTLFHFSLGFSAFWEVPHYIQSTHAASTHPIRVITYIVFLLHGAQLFSKGKTNVE